MKKVVCYFDGSCEPFNPGGTMGMGVVIFIDQQKSHSDSRFVDPDPKNTNNVAEYLALEMILDYLIANNLTTEQIYIYGDSKLVIMQMKCEWKIKQGLYKDHAFRCRGKIYSFFGSNLRLSWVRREENALADMLSKKTSSINISQ